MTIDEAHKKFTDRVGLYKGFLFQTESHFAGTIRTHKWQSEKRAASDFIMPILGSKLLYRNPIIAKYEIAYQHLIDEKNLEESVSHLKKYYFNFVIAQCFEAFETYLKDIIAAFLVSYQENSRLNVDIDTHTYESCRESLSKYSKTKNRYNKRLFKLLYKLEPEIDNIERSNILNFNFKEWYIVFAEIRHSIIHSNSQFESNKSTNWTAFQKTVLNQLFVNAKENETGDISTVEHYDYIIEIVSQHAYILYHYLKNRTE